MSLFHPPSPLAPDLGRRSALRAWTLGLALLAVALIVGLALAGRLSPEPAAAAVLAVAAVTGLVWVTATPLVRVVRAEPIADARADALPAEALTELADGLPEPVLMISGHDRDDYAGRRILFANKAARELLRLPPETALLVAAVRNPEVLEVVDEALFGGIEGQANYEAGGVQERFWRAVAKPLSPGPDGARRALLALRDETDARRNERMRADFLANASHELRTPLASLAGFIDTLRGHAKDDPVARERFLGIMGAQAWRMARLIEDLMSLSRIELNEHIRPSDEVDLILAVTDVMDALAPQAREAGVAFEADLAPRGEAAVVGERDQIVQVAQNLIDNAIKYAGRGGKVRVELERGVTAEAAVTLKNAPRGAPVPADAGPFRRPLRRPAHHGLGAGHQARTPAAPDRTILPGRGPEERRAPGHGPGPGHRQAHHEPAPGRLGGGVGRGRRRNLPGLFPLGPGPAPEYDRNPRGVRRRGDPRHGRHQGVIVIKLSHTRHGANAKGGHIRQ